LTQLSVRAVENASLLRALNKHEPWPSVCELARSIERDESNVRKSLKTLEADGLVIARDLALTEAGAEQLRAIGRAEGGRADMLPKGWAMLRHDQIRPDPANPRTDLSDNDADLDELAGSIAGRGLLQNLVVAPDGMLKAGERRWRAIRKLIHTGEWPPERQILCQVREGDEAETLIDALVENLQRADLNPMDQAEALLKLAGLGKSAAQIKAWIGEGKGPSKRNIQELIQFARELSPEDKAAYRAGTLSREKARERVGEKTRKPALELSARQGLALAEIALAALRHPIEPGLVPDHEGYARLAIPPIGGGPVSQLYLKKLLNVRFVGQTILAKVLAASTPAGDWLKEQGFETDPEACVAILQEKVLGPLEVHHLAGPHTPELREPVREAAPPPVNDPPHSPGEAGTEEEPSPLQDPPPFTGEGNQAQPGGGGPPPAEPGQLSDAKRLVLVETAARITLDGVMTRSGVYGAPISPAYRDDPLAGQLVRDDRMLMFLPGPDGGLLATLSPTGVRWFSDQGFPSAQGRIQITAADLYDARAGAGLDPDAPALGYVTEWLNAAEPAHTVRETVFPMTAEAKDAIAAALREPSPYDPRLDPDAALTQAEIRSAVAEPAAPAAAPSHISEIGRAALQARDEARVIARLDHALAEAAKAIDKAGSKRLDPAEVRSLRALIDNARDLAKPHLDEAA
jgi:ParB/RepB/Spo0J family partition protein